MRDFHIKGKFYANILIVGKKGEHLATISEKRAKWYISKKLATEIVPPHPYPRAIKLTFDHKAVDNPKSWDLQISEDKCVMCGRTNTLSLHHIVPYVVRRHFPEETKKYSREWCVLLCTKCHLRIEKIIQPLYKEKFPPEGPLRKNTNITLQIIKSKGHLNRIPPEKLKLLLSLSDYSNVEDIPPYHGMTTKRKMHSLMSESHREAIRQWALEFIEEHGGIDGTEQYFLDLFLKCEPNHLPTWFSDLKKA